MAIRELRQRPSPIAANDDDDVDDKLIRNETLQL